MLTLGRLNTDSIIDTVKETVRVSSFVSSGSCLNQFRVSERGPKTPINSTARSNTSSDERNTIPVFRDLTVVDIEGLVR